MTLLYNNIVLSHVEQIFIDFQKFKCYSVLPVESKRSNLFAVNNDTNI